MTPLQGARAALFDEYRRAVNDLKSVLAGISPDVLVFAVDPEARDPDCVSIQTVLRHVVRAGYAYANYVREHQGAPAMPWEEALRLSVSEYLDDLDALMAYTADTFHCFTEADLESPDNKILTRWGQTYDLEQLWEHAIVHVLRHRRQVERMALKAK